MAKKELLSRKQFMQTNYSFFFPWISKCHVTVGNYDLFIAEDSYANIDAYRKHLFKTNKHNKDKQNQNKHKRYQHQAPLESCVYVYCDMGLRCVHVYCVFFLSKYSHQWKCGTKFMYVFGAPVVMRTTHESFAMGVVSSSLTEGGDDHSLDLLLNCVQTVVKTVWKSSQINFIDAVRILLQLAQHLR